MHINISAHRLAQLVKNVKKQTFKDPLSDEGSELSIDQAAAYENEVTSWLQDLPARFRFELTQDFGDPAPMSSSGSVLLVAQKCELAILANRLILKLYLPFLKDSDGSGSGSRKPSHQAVLGTINAAHLVIQASRHLHSVWRQIRPAVFDFYDFGRTLFDAAVICAHAVIQQPTSILAAEALRDVSCALNVMRELNTSRVGVEGVRTEGHRYEAIRIVEMMKRKAETVRGGPVAIAGSKRKRREVDGGSVISSGFQLPFVGVAVASAGQAQFSAPKSIATLKDGQYQDPKRNDAKRHSSKDKDKEKDKSTKYPALGIRIRPAQSLANGRSSAAPRSTGQPPSTPMSELGPPQSTVNGYGEPYPGGPVREVMQQEDFTMRFNPDDPNVIDSRRYSFHSSDSSNAGMYDPPPSAGAFPSQNHSRSPPGYNTGTGHPDYYLPYAAGSSTSQAYDSASLPHPQGMPLVGLSGSPMDPIGSSGTIAPPLPAARSEHYLAHEKGLPSNYGSHMGKPSDRDLQRQSPLEYSAAPQQSSHSIPASQVQHHQQHPWPGPQPQPSPGGDLWTSGFKFYGSTMQAS